MVIVPAAQLAVCLASLAQQPLDPHMPGYTGPQPGGGAAGGGGGQTLGSPSGRKVRQRVRQGGSVRWGGVGGTGRVCTALVGAQEGPPWVCGGTQVKDEPRVLNGVSPG